MQNSFRKSMLSTSLLCVLALSGTACAVENDMAAQSNLAARLEARIQTTFHLSPYLRSTDIQVLVAGDKATLSGKVDEIAGKELAEQIAMSANGIKSVDNQIVVDPKYTYAPTSTERSYGEAIDDAGITTAVKSKLLWSKHASGLSTHVDTNRGKVTLTGTAVSKEAQIFAGQLAQNTRGVMSVDNRLEVVAANPETPVNVDEVISDTWITTKVKSTFLYSSRVNGSNISVTTTEGVVVLTGEVASKQERTLAIELAHGLRGVKQVNADALTVI